MIQSRVATPLVTGVIREISKRVAPTAVDRGRGGRSATGRNSRNKFADDQPVRQRHGAAAMALRPLITVDTERVQVE